MGCPVGSLGVMLFRNFILSLWVVGVILFFPSPASAYMGNACMHPLEQMALFSGGARKSSGKNSYKSQIKRFNSSLRTIDRRIDKQKNKLKRATEALGNSLSGSQLSDDPDDVADSITDYIQDEQNGWNCKEEGETGGSVFLYPSLLPGIFGSLLPLLWESTPTYAAPPPSKEKRRAEEKKKLDKQRRQADASDERLKELAKKHKKAQIEKCTKKYSSLNFEKIDRSGNCFCRVRTGPTQFKLSPCEQIEKLKAAQQKKCKTEFSGLEVTGVKGTQCLCKKDSANTTVPCENLRRTQTVGSQTQAGKNCKQSGGVLTLGRDGTEECSCSGIKNAKKDKGKCMCLWRGPDNVWLPCTQVKRLDEATQKRKKDKQIEKCKKDYSFFKLIKLDRAGKCLCRERSWRRGVWLPCEKAEEQRKKEKQKPVDPRCFKKFPDLAVIKGFDTPAGLKCQCLHKGKKDSCENIKKQKPVDPRCFKKFPDLAVIKGFDTPAGLKCQCLHKGKKDSCENIKKQKPVDPRCFKKFPDLAVIKGFDTPAGLKCQCLHKGKKDSCENIKKQKPVDPRCFKKFPDLAVIKGFDTPAGLKCQCLHKGKKDSCENIKKQKPVDPRCFKKFPDLAVIKGFDTPAGLKCQCLHKGKKDSCENIKKQKPVDPRCFKKFPDLAVIKGFDTPAGLKCQCLHKGKKDSCENIKKQKPSKPGRLEQCKKEHSSFDYVKLGPSGNCVCRERSWRRGVWLPCKKDVKPEKPAKPGQLEQCKKEHSSFDYVKLDSSGKNCLCRDRGWRRGVWLPCEKDVKPEKPAKPGQLEQCKKEHSSFDYVKLDSSGKNCLCRDRGWRRGVWLPCEKAEKPAKPGQLEQCKKEHSSFDYVKLDSSGKNCLCRKRGWKPHLWLPCEKAEKPAKPGQLEQCKKEHSSFDYVKLDSSGKNCLCRDRGWRRGVWLPCQKKPEKPKPEKPKPEKPKPEKPKPEKPGELEKCKAEYSSFDYVKLDPSGNCVCRERSWRRGVWLPCKKKPEKPEESGPIEIPNPNPEDTVKPPAVEETVQEKKVCKKWQKKKYFRRKGRVKDRAFCSDFASGKKDCRAAFEDIRKEIEKLRKLKARRKKMEKSLSELEDKKFDAQFSEDEDDDDGTEVGGLCIKCLSDLRQATGPSGWQRFGSGLSVALGAGLSIFGLREARRAQHSTNELLALQGMPAENNFGYSLAGLSLGYPFVARGLHGLTHGNTSNFACNRHPSPYPHPYPTYPMSY